MLSGYQGDPVSVPSGNKSDDSFHENIGVEYLDGLFSYAKRLTRNDSEAEDLVQETYLRAMRAASRLRADSNLKGWLFTILRNTWLNQLRARRTSIQIGDMDVEEIRTGSAVKVIRDQHDVYVGKVEGEQIRAAIQKLPLQLQEIILLREYEDLSYREIADILGCPEGTVMSRLGRARSKLRVLLQEAFTTAPSNLKK